MTSFRGFVGEQGSRLRDVPCEISSHLSEGYAARQDSLSGDGRVSIVSYIVL